MSPYIEDQPNNTDAHVFEAVDHVILNLTPLADFSSPSLSHSISDDYVSSGPESFQEASQTVPNDNLEDIVQRHHISLEFNLKELLTTVSGTDELESVTQLNLRVITREVTLQQLGIYLPSLRELVLDGSIISSLRDLGCGLKNLKVLKVNHCELLCIDGVLGFENLEELFAADNKISDVTPCAFLSNIKTIDIRRNSVKYLHGLSFLKLCPFLENLGFEGNLDFDGFPGYRQAIKRIIPALKILDETPLEQDLASSDEMNNYLALNEDNEYEEVTRQVITPNLGRSGLPARSAVRQLQNNASSLSDGFVVRFPPRVFSNRPNNESHNSAGDNDEDSNNS